MNLIHGLRGMVAAANGANGHEENFPRGGGSAAQHATPHLLETEQPTATAPVSPVRRAPLPLSVRIAIGAVVFAVLISTAHCSEVRWMKVTAYCPCEICCGKGACGITTSGRAAIGPIVAVDPKHIRLGSVLGIPGFGWNVALDTGSAIKGPARVDLLMTSHEDALRFGVRWMPVTLYTAKEWRSAEAARRNAAIFRSLVKRGERLASTQPQP